MQLFGISVFEQQEKITVSHHGQDVRRQAGKRLYAIAALLLAWTAGISSGYAQQAPGAGEKTPEKAASELPSAPPVVDAALQSAAGRKDAVITSSQSSSEPGSRYIDFLIPGLLGMNLMNSGMWGVGFALVEMRQRKLLKRFVATPMRRSDFLLALMSSRLVLMVIEVGLLLGFGVLVFHMRVQGWRPVLSVLGLASLGAVCFGGVGLLTACRAQKIESVSGLINLVMMPMWIFSGVFFSYNKFPRDGPALHQSSTAHRAERRAARHHHRRCFARLAIRTTACACDLGWRFVPSGPPLVSLDVEQVAAIGSQPSVKKTEP